MKRLAQKKDLMKYSKNWLYIDIALFVSFLPVFFILPLPMKLFVILGFVLIYKKHYNLLWISGLLAIFFSFIDFNVKDFKEYVQFLSSLLIFVFILTRFYFLFRSPTRTAKVTHCFVSLSPSEEQIKMGTRSIISNFEYTVGEYWEYIV
jgi:hypothetical protein